jgi:hypothetical protein
MLLACAAISHPEGLYFLIDGIPDQVFCFLRAVTSSPGSDADDFCIMHILNEDGSLEAAGLGWRKADGSMAEPITVWNMDWAVDEIASDAFFTAYVRDGGLLFTQRRSFASLEDQMSRMSLGGRECMAFVRAELNPNERGVTVDTEYRTRPTAANDSPFHADGSRKRNGEIVYKKFKEQYLKDYPDASEDLISSAYNNLTGRPDFTSRHLRTRNYRNQVLEGEGSLCEVDHLSGLYKSVPVCREESFTDEEFHEYRTIKNSSANLAGKSKTSHKTKTKIDNKRRFNKTELTKDYYMEVQAQAKLGREHSELASSEKVKMALLREAELDEAAAEISKMLMDAAAGNPVDIPKLKENIELLETISLTPVEIIENEVIQVSAALRGEFGDRVTTPAPWTAQSAPNPTPSGEGYSSSSTGYANISSGYAGHSSGHGGYSGLSSGFSGYSGLSSGFSGYSGLSSGFSGYSGLSSGFSGYTSSIQSSHGMRSTSHMGSGTRAESLWDVYRSTHQGLGLSRSEMREGYKLYRGYR